MQELINKVISWADERGIITDSSTEKQLEKTAAEFTELCIAVGKDATDGTGVYSAEVADGVGDVLVTLIIVCEMLGLDIEDCLQISYDQIKDRKGKMINGKFVKESDL